MPVPTETLWNIKRLNVVFLVSMVALVGVMFWSVHQDFDKSWRKPQQASRVWDAALVRDKLDSIPPDEIDKINELKNLATRLENEVKSGGFDAEGLAKAAEQVRDKYSRKGALTATEKQELDDVVALMRSPSQVAELKQYKAWSDQLADLDSRRATLLFSHNNLKSIVTVDENSLQAARTAGDAEGVKRLEQGLAPGREKIAKNNAELGAMKAQMDELKAKRIKAMKEVDDVRKLATRLNADIELNRKRLRGLDPRAHDGFLDQTKARVSQHLRDAPLMPFRNASEKVHQIVLPDVQTDVSFMKINTVDRCMSCHVHVDRKEYSEDNILAYLEEQLAAGRAIKFGEGAGTATYDAPGAAALPEFWHHWALKLAPAALKPNDERIADLINTVGEGVTVREHGLTRDREPLALNEYNPADPADNAAVVALVNAWLRHPAAPEKTKRQPAQGEIIVEIGKVDDELATKARAAAFAHAAAMRAAVESAASKENLRLLRHRYRHDLVERVNVFRKQKGFDALDPSPVLLAHPKLDLYVDVDSPHHWEAVGCTSCHDGSGQETNFVLTAHVSRGIWVDAETGEPVLNLQVEPKKEANGGHNGHADGHADHSPADREVKSLSDMRSVVLHGNVNDLLLTLGKHHDGPTTQPAAGPALVNAGVTPKEETTLSYVDPVTGQRRKAQHQLDHWKGKYEREAGTPFWRVYHEWDWPMRPGHTIQANCARCHSNIHDIKDHAPVLYEGRNLFAKHGCVNCHQMDSVPVAEATRKVGPDLRQVPEKLSTAFLHSWIWAPKSFRPSTMMPHFFMLENNSSDEEIRRTQQEVRAMTFYLQRTATTRPATPIVADSKNKMPDLGNEEERAARGRTLFMGLAEGTEPDNDKQAGVGCLGCHTNLNEVGLKWITTDLVKKGGYTAATARTRYQAMSYNERQLYALDNFPEPTDGSLPRYSDGSIKPVFQQHGPELSAVGTKLLAGGRDKKQAIEWLYKWLLDPRNHSEYTVMPRLRLSPEEALDLACYLVAQERTSKASNDKWAAAEIVPDTEKISELLAMFLYSQYDVATAKKKAVETATLDVLARNTLRTLAISPAEVDKRLAELKTDEEKQLLFLGQKLLNHYGCMNCHAINGLQGAASPCANLSDWGQKRVPMLDFGMVDHHHVHEFEHNGRTTLDIPMVNGLSPDAVSAVIEKNNAKDWSKPLAKSMDVHWPDIAHGRNDWLAAKLKNTRIFDRGRNLLEPRRERNPDGTWKVTQTTNHKGETVTLPVVDPNNPGKPYDKLRMPTFYFSDEQVEAIVTFVVSNRDKLITPKLLAKTNTEEAKTIAHGRQLLDKYNCTGCHRVENNTPSVQQYWAPTAGYFPKDDMPAKAPPMLRGEGARVQHGWLFNFLKHVERGGTGPQGKIRPIPFIRMPSFPVSDDEATAFAAYFATVSNKETKLLAKKVDGLVKAAAPRPQPGEPPVKIDEVWPPDDWHKDPKNAALAAFLRDWSTEFTGLRPADFADADPVVVTRAYKNALYDARFTAASFKAAYPFVEMARPTPSEEQFKLGEKLFHYMQCHTCHVVGDEKNPGVNQQPKAPNFSLAHQRLQRNWSWHWVQEPQIIQPGSAMPAIFFSGRAITSINPPDRAIFELKGLPHVPSATTPELTKQLATQLQFNFGQTVEEQKQLVLDYIWAAGIRGHTAIDPPAPPPPPAGQPPPPPVPLKATPPDYKPAPIPGITAPLPEPTKTAPDQAPRIDTPKPPVAVLPQGPSIVGKVTFDGTPPPQASTPMNDANCAKHHPGGRLPSDELVVDKDTKAIRDVIVYVSKGAPRGAPVPPPAVVDQKGCRYEPHVVAMTIGQELRVGNSDPFAHNVNPRADANRTTPFSQSNITPPMLVGRMTKVEQFIVKCDIHPWMSTNVHVFDHPFTAVTKADGTYTISNLPPGKYTITTRHRKLGAQSVDVVVPEGNPAEANLALKPGGGE